MDTVPVMDNTTHVVVMAGSQWDPPGHSIFGPQIAWLIFIGDTKNWRRPGVSPHFTTVHKRNVARWIRVCCKHAQGDPSQRCAGVLHFSQMIP